MVVAQKMADVNTQQQREIQIKQAQLKIAQDGNMPLVAAAIQQQLDQLQTGNAILQRSRYAIAKTYSPPESISKPKNDSDFQALMSLLDD